jgi:predicted nucleic acid-binding protein
MDTIVMSELTAEAALKLVGEIFVYHMPLIALGLKLER